MFFVYLLFVAVSSRPIAQTQCGTVAGIWETDNVAAFHGIRYGAAPINEQRWQPPVAAACWNGTLDASKDGPVCFQFGNVDPPPPQSEDCLLLNVYTKSLPSSENGKRGSNLAPVIVWIHGGSLIWGWATQYSDLSNLVRLPTSEQEEVVVVALQYRLNAFGFLALDVLSQQDRRGVSGNYGFLDQQLALQWVHDNIMAFGGDPTRVTVLGQSSGGTSIFALLSSPASVGLFHAAISLSGSPNISMTLEYAEAQNEPIMDTLGCQDVDCLLNLSPQQIVQAIPDSWNFAPTGFPESLGGFHYPGLTVVDGQTITMSFVEALAQGLVDVPLIIQSMAQEMDLWANLTIANWTVAEYQNYLSDSLQLFSPDAGSIIASAYADVFASNASGLIDVTLTTDDGLTCANPVVASVAAKGFQSPVYLSYVAQWPSSPLIAPSATGLFPILYASHLWDYIAATNAWDFFTLDGAPVFPANSDDVALGQVIRNSWYELASMGKISEWEPVNAYGEAHVVTNVIDHDTVQSQLDFKANACQAWSYIGFGVGEWWCN